MNDIILLTLPASVDRKKVETGRQAGKEKGTPLSLCLPLLSLLLSLLYVSLWAFLLPDLGRWLVVGFSISAHFCMSVMLRLHVSMAACSENNENNNK